MNSFRVGDAVTWMTQAGGRYRQRTGTVIEVVPPGEQPMERLNNKYRQYEAKHGAVSVAVAAPRKHESYVVECVLPGRGKVRYWPKVMWLKLLPDAGETHAAAA